MVWPGWSHQEHLGPVSITLCWPLLAGDVTDSQHKLDRPGPRPQPPAPQPVAQHWRQWPAPSQSYHNNNSAMHGLRCISDEAILFTYFKGVATLKELIESIMPRKCQNKCPLCS